MDPKRSLGQNFLRNKNLAESIVRYVLSSDPEQLFEVGPGTGVFTHLFLKQGVSVVAVEKDDDLSRMLSTLNTPDLKLINKDILELSSSEINEMVVAPDRTVCFGSLPYNISKRIVSRLVTKFEFSSYYFILQREVAGKYVFGKKGNRLSAFINAYATPRVIMNISPSNFYPKPKVTSTLIKFAPHYSPMIDKKHAEKYELFTKDLYSNPRKMVNKNSIFKDLSIPEEIRSLRPEELSLEQIIVLFQMINT